MEQRVALLEQQMAAMEARHASEIADLQQTVMSLNKIYHVRAEEFSACLEEGHFPTGAASPVIAAAPGQRRATLPPKRLAVPHSSLASSLPATPVARLPRDAGEESFSCSQPDNEEGGGPARLPAEAAGAIARHQSRLGAIYDHYATSNSGSAIFHPAMGLGAFTRMVRDCKLCTTACRPGCTPELLWMAVVRSLGTGRAATAAAAGGSPQNPSRSTLMTRGRYQATPDTKDHFAFLRAEKIQRRHFVEALHLLWLEWSDAAGRPSRCRSNSSSGRSRDRRASSRERLSMLPLNSTGLGAKAADFETFLTRRILPGTAAAMERQRRREAGLLSASYSALLTPWSASLSDLPGAARGGEGYATPGPRSSVDALVEDYAAVATRYAASAAVKAIVKEFAVNVKRSFQGGGGGGGGGMTVDDFFALVRSHHLLPLITKVELRHIFRDCSCGTSSSPPLLTLGGYLNAVYCLAEAIYSAPAVAAHYPTPEARLQKLFAKMFILSQ